MHNKEITKRIDMDLRARSLNGAVLYLFFLPLMFFAVDFYNQQPQLAMYFTIAMTGVSFLRLVLWFKGIRVYDFSPNLWRALFTLFSLSHAGILSYFFTLSLFDERFASLQPFALLVLGGIASAGVIAFTPRILLSLSYLYVLVLPIMTVSFYSQSDKALVLMMIVFILFITSLAVTSFKDYTRSFDIEITLDEQKKVLEDINKIDGLTKVHNRSHFNDEFGQRWLRAIRHNISEAIILIDIDHFKKFNDNYGHLCGDACLIHVASVVSGIVGRSSDLFARFGGEEFVVLLADCPQDSALAIAERIRLAIQSTPLEYDNRVLSVTASLGVAHMLPRLTTEKEVLLIAADNAMYIAKEQGRNRVVVNTQRL